MAILQVTSREFRENQASFFALADKGNRIVVTRRGKISYMLMPVTGNDFVPSPELEHRLCEARQEYNEGKTISCKTLSDLQKHLDSL